LYLIFRALSYFRYYLFFVVFSKHFSDGTRYVINEKINYSLDDDFLKYTPKIREHLIDEIDTMVYIVLVSFLTDTFDFGLIIYKLIDFIQHENNAYSASKIDSLFLILVWRSSWNYSKYNKEKNILSHSYVKELRNLFKRNIRSVFTILYLALIEHQTIINVSETLLFLFNFLLLLSQWLLLGFLAPSLFL
jgi:hypothetical protein